MRRGGLTAVGQQLENDRGTRHGDQQTGEDRLRKRAEIPPTRDHDDHRRADDLWQTDSRHQRQHDEQSRHRKLEPDGEQQHDDTDLGQQFHALDVGNERQPIGPHEDAGDKQPDDAGHAGLTEDEDDRSSDGKHDKEVGEKHGRILKDGRGRFHHKTPGERGLFSAYGRPV